MPDPRPAPDALEEIREHLDTIQSSPVRYGNMPLEILTAALGIRKAAERLAGERDGEKEMHGRTEGQRDGYEELLHEARRERDAARAWRQRVMDAVGGYTVVTVDGPCDLASWLERFDDSGDGDRAVLTFPDE